MVGSHHFQNLILDLGDVLFHWSKETKTRIPPKTLKSIVTSPTWFDYERGRLTEEACYAAVGAEFSIPASEIAQAFEQARASLTPDFEMFEFVQELKAANPGLRVFAMSNISASDYQYLQRQPVDWSIFDRVFPSSSVGERKPHLGFYRHVIQAADIQPRETIFVDDKLDNVLSAKSLGFQGVQFDGRDACKRALRNLLGDPIARGNAYLRANAKNLHSVTSATDKIPETVIYENFAQLFILEATNNPDLVDIIEHEGAWNFFHGGKGQLTTEAFPADFDTTSLGSTIFKRDLSTANSLMDEMLEYVDNDGILQTYFDRRRPRFDPVVCVNALTFFYTYGRGNDLGHTLDWVYEVLLNRAYLNGTRYYTTAECFLFCIYRLLDNVHDDELHALLMPLLKERIQERIGAEGDAIALAMRINVCNFVGIKNEVDMRALLPLQCEDGGWEIGWVYKYGASGLKIGNRGLTTVLAVKAIMEFDRSHSRPTSPTPTVAVEQVHTLRKKRSFLDSKLVTSLNQKVKTAGRRWFHIPRRHDIVTSSH